MNHHNKKHLGQWVALAFLAMAAQGTAYAAPMAVQDESQPVETQAMLDAEVPVQDEKKSTLSADEVIKKSQKIDDKQGGQFLGETIVTASRRAHNPYITGGDVNVITRADIEKHNYQSVIDAIRDVPGVRIASPGYHGGEYGYETYQTDLTINGEAGIVVVVDGNRIDNDASAFAGNKAKVNLATLPGIDDVQRIEVIKGSGAAIYGADAAGGVLAITTRQGTKKPHTTLNLATGSWNHHRYSLTHTGSAQEGSLRYALSLSQEMQGDSAYKDAFSGQTLNFDNTDWHQKNAAVNITKDFDDQHTLQVHYYHASERASYPITAPDSRYLEAFYEGNIAPADPNDPRYYANSANGIRFSQRPGYRNQFLYDAWLGSHDEMSTNNVSAKYVFGKTDEHMESFLRVFRNHTRYNMVDYSSIYRVRYPYFQEFLSSARAHGNIHQDIETSTGVTAQIARHVGKHSVTGGLEWKRSEYEGLEGGDTSNASRNLWDLYLQDKIKLSHKFLLTPGLIYSHWGAADYLSTKTDAASRATFSVYGSYDFDKQTNAYFSAAQIFKPITGQDLRRQFAQDPLKNETGISWTAGLSRAFTPRDSAEINYSVTDMDNAIARYSVLDTQTGRYASHAVNAKRNKKAMNLGYTHHFNNAWTFGATYSWVTENFSAKNVRRDPEGTSTDDLINAYRPKNVYRFHVSYDKGPWFADLSHTIYSGNDTRYFSKASFGVTDFSLNYRVSKDWQAYLNIYNLFNEAYETKASAYNGIGSFPQPARSFLLGMKYTF